MTLKEVFFLAFCMLAAGMLMIALTTAPQVFPLGASLCLYVGSSALIILGFEQIRTAWKRHNV